MAELTPVERGVLVALMAAGGRLRENADLVERYQIRMTAGHRKKLAELGLIKTSKKPFTHELTDAGWAFMGADFPMDVPREPMKIGALNAVVDGLRRLSGNDASALKAVVSGASQAPSDEKAPEPDPEKIESPQSSGTFDDAAWSDSEEALAMALQDIAAFGPRMKAVEKAGGDDLANPLKQLSLNADSIFQNIRLAARKRGMEALFARGEETEFDSALFDCFEDMDEGEPAIVMKQPVVKHTARDGKIIVLRGLASPAD